MSQNYSLNGVLVSKEKYEKARGIISVEPKKEEPNKEEIKKEEKKEEPKESKNESLPQPTKDKPKK